MYKILLGLNKLIYLSLILGVIDTSTLTIVISHSLLYIQVTTI